MNKALLLLDAFTSYFKVNARNGAWISTGHLWRFGITHLFPWTTYKWRFYFPIVDPFYFMKNKLLLLLLLGMQRFGNFSYRQTRCIGLGRIGFGRCIGRFFNYYKNALCSPVADPGGMRGLHPPLAKGKCQKSSKSKIKLVEILHFGPCIPPPTIFHPPLTFFPASAPVAIRSCSIFTAFSMAMVSNRRSPLTALPIKMQLLLFLQFSVWSQRNVT